MRTMTQWEFNPVIVKEFRSMMRGGRAFGALSICLVFLGAFSYIFYRVILAKAQYSYSPLNPQIGQSLFTGMLFLELLLICAITPAVTAGSISGEKEIKTFDILMGTPLHPVSILWGKLFSALSFIFILIFAFVPMVSLIFVFGGVSPRDIIKALLLLLVVASMIGVIGIFMSTLFGRTSRATASTYLAVLILVIAPLFISSIAGVLKGTTPIRWILIPSPISALASALPFAFDPQNLTMLTISGGWGIQWIMGPPPISTTEIPRPLYHYSLPLYGGITLVLFLLSTRLVRSVQRWRIHWYEALLGLVLVLGYVGLVGIAFYATTNRYENIIIVYPQSQLHSQDEFYSFTSQNGK